VIYDLASWLGSLGCWVICHSYFPATPFACSCSVIHLSASYSVIKPLITSVSPSGHRISTPQQTREFSAPRKLVAARTSFEYAPVGSHFKPAILPQSSDPLPGPPNIATRIKASLAALCHSRSLVNICRKLSNVVAGVLKNDELATAR
jgi:hypothetical protein